jgi:hypothetical protein
MVAPTRRKYMSQSRKRGLVKSSALQAASVTMLVLLCAPGSSGFWSGAGWAQGVGQTQRPIRILRTIPPASAIPAPDPLPVRELTGVLGTSLAACDKEAQNPDNLILPGAKGDLKLDRCYRGRDQFVCSFNALLTEAKSLLEDYRKVVDARYPEVSNVGDVCKIKPDNLAVDMQNATDFANRFKMLKAEYEARIGCANKVGQALKDVTLPDMAQAPGILKSMMDAIEADVRGVSDQEAKVVELAEKIDTSQRAMVTLRKIHRSICLQGQRPPSQEDRASR